MNENLKRLFERTIIIRSIRKYIRLNGLEFTEDDLKEIIVRILNFFLSDEKARKHLDIKLNDLQERKKRGERLLSINNKNRGQRQYKSPLDDEKELNSILLIKSTEFFEIIKNIATERYGFNNFTSYENLKFNQTYIDKLCFLREASLLLGINIQMRNFCFFSSDNIEYPIKEQDIVSIIPLVKQPNFNLEILKFNFRAAESEANEKNYDNALNILQGCFNLIISTSGIYCGDFIFTCTKIASIFYLKI